MIENIFKIANTKSGQIVISIILGIGLASIFRKVCNSRECLVFEAPKLKDITENTYKHDGRCYKFKEKSVTCHSDKKIVNFT